MNISKANQYKAFFRGLLNNKNSNYRQWCSAEHYAFRYNRSRGIGDISIKTTVEMVRSFGDFYCASVYVTAHRKTYIKRASVLSETQDFVYSIYFKDDIPSLDDLENEVISLIKKLGWL